MVTPFWKYHGCGNDFVIVDGRVAAPRLSPASAAALCHRNYGVGADGLIVAERSITADCRMVLYNADGSLAEMCGNGLRCLAAYLSKSTGKQDITIECVDGVHAVNVTPSADENTVTATATMAALSSGTAEPEIQEVELRIDNASITVYALNTGVPHVVVFVDDVHEFGLFEEFGRQLRHHSAFAPEGTNVNIVSKTDVQSLDIRTYERGVEAETLACGTGATAAALVAYQRLNIPNSVNIRFATGYQLTITIPSDFSDPILMTGPATCVYEGTLPTHASSETIAPTGKSTSPKQGAAAAAELLNH